MYMYILCSGYIMLQSLSHIPAAVSAAPRGTIYGEEKREASTMNMLQLYIYKRNGSEVCGGSVIQYG